MVPIPLNFIEQNTRWWAQIIPGRNTHIPYVASILALAQFFLVSEIKSIHQSRALQSVYIHQKHGWSHVKNMSVGGFNHLEKYESQWEGLSHILCIMENKQCLKPPSSMKSPRGCKILPGIWSDTFRSPHSRTSLAPHEGHEANWLRGPSHH